MNNQATHSEEQQQQQLALVSQQPSLYEIFNGKLASQVRRLAQWRKRGGVGGKAREARRQKAMQFETVEPRILLSADLGAIGASAFTAYFDAVQVQLDEDVFSAPIPLIGTQLADIASGKIAQNISDALRNFSTTPAGPAVTVDEVNAGLRSALGGMIQNDQIGVTTSVDNSEYRFALTLGGSASDRINLDLALGKDALLTAQLGIVEEVALSFDWSFDLVFGTFENAALESLFYIDTASANELRLENVLAVLDGGDDLQLAAKGTAGIFGALIQMDQGRQAKPATFVDPAVAFVAAKPSQFTGKFDIDVTGGGADRRLTLPEIPAMGVTGLVTGTSDIHLDIDASLFPNFADVDMSNRVFDLGVQADVRITQELSAANTGAEVFGDPITLSYDDVRMDLGDFFSDFFDPTVKALQTVLSPIKPIVDFLTYPIPVLSDLGDEPITPLDLGYVAIAANKKLDLAEKKEQSEKLTKARTALGVLNSFYDLQPVGQGLPEQFASVGDISLQLAGSKRDPVSPELEEPKKPTLTRMNASSDLLKEAQSTPYSEGYAEFSGNLQFPFLVDPSAVLDMLLGDATAQLVSFDIGFDFGYQFGQEFPIIPGVLAAQIELDIGASLNFGAGYDLAGAKALTQKLDFSSDEEALKQSVDTYAYLLEDGFYFDDHFGEDASPTLQDGDVADTTISIGNGPDDKDHPELTLYATMTAGAKVGEDILIAEFTAGADLSFTTEVMFDLNDLPEPQNAAQADYVRNVGESPVPEAPYTYDGRVRISELALIADADPFAVFNTTGALTAGLSAYVYASVGVSPFKVVLVDETVNLVTVPIFDFNIHTLDDADVLAGIQIRPPVLGKVTNGTLDLYMGLTADKRVNTGPGRIGQDDAIDEGFSITSRGLTSANDPDGGETLVVKFLVRDGDKWVVRATDTFDNVKRVVADGDDGDDSIVVDAAVAASVKLSGGKGNDTLTYKGSGVAELAGGDDNDLLIGGSNADVLDGGDGDDELHGGAGADELRGGARNDRLDGGLGDDTLQGDAGSDTYSWSVGQGADDIVEGEDGAGVDIDRITIGGTDSADDVSVSKVIDGGVLKVLLQNGNAESGIASLLLDNIEGLSINAGAGSDTITIGDLTGTDVNLFAVDLSSPEVSGSGVEGDTVVFNGTGFADRLSIQGVVAGFDQTNLGAPAEDVPAPFKNILQLIDDTPAGNGMAARNSNFFIINSSPDRDTLEVQGLGGNDILSVSKGSAGIDVSDLIAVTLDGGADNDTLRSVYDNVTLIGGDGVDGVEIGSDDKALVGAATLELSATDLLVSRVKSGLGVAADRQVDDRLSFSGFDTFDLTLGAGGTGNDLTVFGSIDGAVGITGSSGPDMIALRALAGDTTVALNGGANTVTVGNQGSLAGIVGNLDIRGGIGADAVVFDGSAEVLDTLAQIGVTAITGLVTGQSAPDALQYDAAVESVALRLGRGNDQVAIADLTRRVIVDLGIGSDSVDATLLGTPTGAASAAGLETTGVEQVSMRNEANNEATDWLITGNQLRADDPARIGEPGVFSPVASGLYDQVVLQTAGADIVSLALGEGSDRLRIWDLATETHIDLRGGDDDVVVGDAREGAQRKLADIDALLVLDACATGETGGDTLRIDDISNTVNGFADAALPSLVLGTQRIDGTSMGAQAGIGHSGFSSLVVNLSDKLDNVRILDTAITTTLDLGGGDDLLFVENTSAGNAAAPGTMVRLGDGKDQVTVFAGTGLVVDAADGSGPDTLTFDVRGSDAPLLGGVLGEQGGSGMLTSLGPIADVAFDGIEVAQVELGQNNDNFTVDIGLGVRRHRGRAGRTRPEQRQLHCRHRPGGSVRRYTWQRRR